MPSPAVARRIAISIIVATFVAAASSAFIFGAASPVTMIMLVVLLVGLRIAASKLKRSTE